MFNYDNIGKKIKNLAKWTFVIGAIGTVIAGISLMSRGDEIEDDGVIEGILTVILGPVVAWAVSLLLYGFGELIDKACEIARNTSNKGKIDESVQKVTEKKKRKAEVRAIQKVAEQPEREMVARTRETEASANAVRELTYYDVICPQCGELLSFREDIKKPECPYCECEFDISVQAK